MLVERETEKLMKALMKSENIENYIKENEQSFIDCSFSECLNMFLAEKKLKRSDVLSDVLIGKSYLYELFEGTKESPSRDVVIQLCFGLRLTLEESHILFRAGNFCALSCQYKRDFVIIFSLAKGFSIMKCNEMLDDIGEELIR